MFCLSHSVMQISGIECNRGKVSSSGKRITSYRVKKLQVRLKTAGLLSDDSLCLYLYELVEYRTSHSHQVFQMTNTHHIYAEGKDVKMTKCT